MTYRRRSLEPFCGCAIITLVVGNPSCRRIIVDQFAQAVKLVDTSLHQTMGGLLHNRLLKVRSDVKQCGINPEGACRDNHREGVWQRRVRARSWPIRCCWLHSWKLMVTVSPASQRKDVISAFFGNSNTSQPSNPVPRRRTWGRSTSSIRPLC